MPLFILLPTKLSVNQSVNRLNTTGINLLSLMNLLDSMRSFSIPAHVFSSSCTVYGQPAELPVTEDAPVQPAASPYGNTKQNGEEIIRDSVSAYKKYLRHLIKIFQSDRCSSSALIGELPRGVSGKPGPLHNPDSLWIEG
jgi:UDP-glucose 4-epimerase